MRYKPYTLLVFQRKKFSEWMESQQKTVESLAQELKLNPEYLSKVLREDHLTDKVFDRLNTLKDFNIMEFLKEESNIPNILGTHIKDLREKHNLTQEKLANAIDVTKQAVSNWESGRRDPNLTQRDKLCRYFGISEAELFGAPPATINPDQRLIPVFDASCGDFIDWSDGSYPVGHYPENKVTDSKDPHAFYVRAHGDSMTGRADDRRTIFDGDLLLVEPSKQINDGDIVFCRNDGRGITVKKFKRAKDKIHLIPLNDKYDIMVLNGQDKCHCFKITEIKRKM